jgi:prepilin-type processing-associated H-X9-DG protein
MNWWLNGWNPDETLTPKIRPEDKTKYQQLISPSPIETFVFIDENEQSIGDGAFVLPAPWAPQDKWLSQPSDRHDRGGNLSFADSHVQSWHWKAPKHLTIKYQPAADPADQADLSRLEAAIPNR